VACSAKLIPINRQYEYKGVRKRKYPF